MPQNSLHKTLGPVSLTALGIGAVIGSGIFTVIGTAIGGNPAQQATWAESPVIDLFLGWLHHTSGAVAGRPGAGPALALSLVLVAIVCALTGLCYAELASMIPIAGSAYTYTYATMGELIAWIIGWDLILEYAFSNMSVSVGFAAHIVDLLDWLGINLSPKWLSPAYLPLGLQDLAGKDIYAAGWHAGFDIPAFLVVMILTVILVRGIRESARTNNIMVLIKIAAILLFVSFGASFIHTNNYHPYSPNGWTGVLAGGSIIFFTYIGFDSVSTASEECRNPRRDVPIGIIATLIVCTILYVGVAVVLTGIVPWRSVAGDGAPVVNALKRVSLLPGGHRLHFVRLAVLLGALVGMVSSILVFQLGQARVWFAMSRDRLLPDVFSRVHPRFRTPAFATWVAGVLVAIPAGLFDVGTLAEMSNIGTLFAFVLVSCGVVILRYKDPGRRRGFRVPFGPVHQNKLSKDLLHITAVLIVAGVIDTVFVDLFAGSPSLLWGAQAIIIICALLWLSRVIPIIPVLSVLFCILLMAGLPARTWLRFFVWLIIGLFVYVLYSRKRSEFYKAP